MVSVCQQKNVNEDRSPFQTQGLKDILETGVWKEKANFTAHTKTLALCRYTHLFTALYTHVPAHLSLCKNLGKEV